MKRILVVAALGFLACGPSYGGQGVKTPDELIDEQDRLAAEEEKNKRPDDNSSSSEETDSEKKRTFDRKQAKMELQRATRSAESCPGVVSEQETKDKKPRGATSATITFQEDGTVKSVSVPSPFDGTPVGDCVLRAYKGVIVPPFTGGDQIVDFELELKDAPKPKEGGDAAAKGKKK